MTTKIKVAGPQTEADAAKAAQTEGNIGLNDVPKFANAVRRAAITNQLKKQLKSEHRGIVCGILPMSIENCLLSLEQTTGTKETGESVQRPVEWSHAEILATLMRNAMDPDRQHIDPWYEGVNMQVVSADNDKIDGRHRDIAYITAFGSASDIDRMMRVLGGHDPQPTTLTPSDYRKLPIRGWSVNPDHGQPGHIDPPAWAMPISFGAHPQSFIMLNSYKKEYEPTDALVMHPESSARLARMGVKAESETVNVKTYATTLRMVYLRTMKLEDRDGKPQYGSLSKGGAIGPERYPVYDDLFGETVENAYNLLRARIDAGKDDTDFEEANIGNVGYHIVLTALTLFLLGNGKEKDAEWAIDRLAKQDAPKNTAGAWIKSWLAGKKSYTVKDAKISISSSGVMAMLVRLLTDVEGTTYTQSQWINPLTDKPNDPPFRFDGPDTDGLDPDLLAASELKVIGKKAQAYSKANAKAKAKTKRK